MQTSLSVVMPAYNEQATILRVARRVLDLPVVQQLVIVDDYSSDATGELIDGLASTDARVQVVHHAANQGKTEALKTGIAATIGDIVIVQDADLEYDPAEIPKVIAPIQSGATDVVYGSRFLQPSQLRPVRWHDNLANKTLTFLSNLFSGLRLTDVETGYKAFRGEVIRNMHLTSSGFGFEIEVTAKARKLGCDIQEVPVSYRGRTYAEGKKIGLRDGLAALWYIVKFNCFCSLEKSFTKAGRELPKSSRAA